MTNTGNTESTYNAFLNVPGVQQMLDGEHYDFQLLITRTSLVPGFLQTASGCVAAAETKVQVIANLQIPTKTAAQFQAISGSPSSVATFSVAPEGGAAVPTISADGQSVVARDEVKITLRAIRLRPLASIPANLVFNPAAVVLTVASTSTNVLNGVVQPDGTQPTATATTTTLALSSPAVAAVGEPVTLTATVSPAPPNAAGAIVEFFDGDTLLGTGTIDDGEANFTTTDLPFAVHSFRARFAGTPTLSPSVSGVVVQHMVQQFGDAASFNDAIAGQAAGVQDFNSPATGTPISALNPIGGVLTFTSSFDTLEIFGGVPAPPPGEGLIGTTAFGLNDGTRTNGRYDLLFNGPGGDALGFDIFAQDPAASPASIELLTSAGSTFFVATNPGPESSNVFHGFRATLPILGARVYEGCEVGQPVVPGCLNEEIAIDNVTTVGRDVRLWSTDSGGNGHYYEYVREGGLSWEQANRAAQARTYLCLLYTSPSPRDRQKSRMPSSA